MWDRIGPNAADLFECLTLKKQVAPKGLSFDATRIFGEPVGIRTRDLLIKSQCKLSKKVASLCGILQVLTIFN